MIRIRVQVVNRVISILILEKTVLVITIEWSVALRRMLERHATQALHLLL